jgi:hypothetical protein
LSLIVSGSLDSGPVLFNLLVDLFNSKSVCSGAVFLGASLESGLVLGSLGIEVGDSSSVVSDSLLSNDNEFSLGQNSVAVYRSNVLVLLDNNQFVLNNLLLSDINVVLLSDDQFLALGNLGLLG